MDTKDLKMLSEISPTWTGDDLAEPVTPPVPDTDVAGPCTAVIVLCVIVALC